LRVDQNRGLHIQCFGSADQIGLVRGKEIKDRPVRRHIGHTSPQTIGRQAGQFEKTLRAILIGEDPTQRSKCHFRSVVIHFFTTTANCNIPSLEVRATNKASDRQGSDEAIGGAMTKRILVVEDNDLNRKLFCDVLQAGGFSVEPVADGKLAIERARIFSPNLVVMDIQLQDVSGLDLINSLKHDNDLSNVPVLAVTAYAGKGDEERIRESGAEGYLSKPVSIGPFMAAVRGLVEAAA